MAVDSLQISAGTAEAPAALGPPHLAQSAAAPTYPVSARVGSADLPRSVPSVGLRPPIPSMSDAPRFGAAVLCL
jgi:hypothetical protein